VILED
jgi:hypothetical protein